MIPTAEAFRQALESIFADARENRQVYVNIVSGELHVQVPVGILLQTTVCHAAPL
ncbi:hypothetical protein [Peribacillus butanolivorans]|uniref:hypothetical protein n=1 Tax=Peribacillus butanolivorans TaxID=421767 RepID=UPI003671EE85